MSPKMRTKTRVWDGQEQVLLQTSGECTSIQRQPEIGMIRESIHVRKVSRIEERGWIGSDVP